MNFEICVIYLSVSLLCYFFGVVAIKKAFEREGTNTMFYQRLKMVPFKLLE